MEKPTKLSLAARHTYTELLSHTSLNIPPSGGFTKKKIGGVTYVYFQHRDILGCMHQTYLGIDNEALRAFIAGYQAGNEQLTRLGQSAIALGCEAIPFQSFKTIKRLSDYGFFKDGGLLLGDYCYAVTMNLMGHIPLDQNTRLLSLLLTHYKNNNPKDHLLALSNGQIVINNMGKQLRAGNIKKLEFDNALLIEGAIDVFLMSKSDIAKVRIPHPLRFANHAIEHGNPDHGDEIIRSIEEIDKDGDVDIQRRINLNEDEVYIDAGSIEIDSENPKSIELNDEEFEDIQKI